jgi:hypothetical protein
VSTEYRVPRKSRFLRPSLSLGGRNDKDYGWEKARNLNLSHKQFRLDSGRGRALESYECSLAVPELADLCAG